MGFTTQTEEANSKTRVGARLTPRILRDARFLIVCEDDSITERLSSFLREAGFISEHVKSMTAGCSSARSGQFQVVFTSPVLADGSWTRLVDIASQFDLGFVVVLVATTFDLKQWGEALEAGAFDVLDAVYELPKAAEMARCALWAAYLKGAGPRPRAAGAVMAA